MKNNRCSKIEQGEANGGRAFLYIGRGKPEREKREGENGN